MKRTVRIACSAVAVLFLIINGTNLLLSQTPDLATKLRLAQGLEQSGEFERAATLYNELLSRDPSNYLYFDGLQRMLLQLKRYDEAITLIQKRIAQNPSDINLHGLLGSVLYKAGNEREANTEWDRALSVEPSNPNVYRLVAGILLDNRLLDRAADIYRRGRVACKDPNLFTIELAQLLIASMDYAGATTEFLRWLDQNPTQLPFVQTRMASFTGKDDGRAAAISAVKAAIERNTNVRLYELLGWLYLEGKKLDEAFDVYRTIDRMTNAHGTAIYAFAERAFKERNFVLASKAYLEAINTPVPPNKLPYARYGYASSLMELGAVADTLRGPYFEGQQATTDSRPEYKGAVSYFRGIIQDYPRTEFSARSYFQIGVIQFERFFDLDGALLSFEQVGKEVASINVLRYSVALKQGEVFTAKGDTAHAAGEFQTVAAAPDATPDQIDEAQYRLAELDYFGGKFPQAIERLGSITMNLKADETNDALLLQSFLQENSLTAVPALSEYAHSEFLARQRKNTEAVAVLQGVITKYPQAILADEALLRVAELQADAGQYAEAIASYGRLLADFKETSKTLDRAEFRIGEVYQYGLKNTAKAIEAYEHLLADHPHSLLTTEARKRIRLLRGDAL